MVYTEDPLQRIVNVHWEDDGGVEPPDFYWPCGAFKHGYGLGTSFGDRPGRSIFILADWNIYGIGFDGNPNHAPTKPYNYWWSASDYLPKGVVHDGRDIPYIWGPGQDFTVTVDMATLAERQPHMIPGAVRILEFRNFNIQVINSSPGFTADRVVDGPVIDIANHIEGEIYPPGFQVQILTTELEGVWRTITYPPTLIQAHCEHETTGAYPPSPPGYPPGNYWYQYPAQGSTLYPVRPPPPPPWEEE